MQAINIIKRSRKTCQIFTRQSRYQIQVLMNVVIFLNFLHLFSNLIKLHRPMNFSDSVGIRRLHANLQLNQSRLMAPSIQSLPLSEDLQIFQNEIGNTIIMLSDILPNLHCMTVTAVKCPVHKLHLGDLVFQEKLQFLFHQLQTSEAKLLSTEDRQ